MLDHVQSSLIHKPNIPGSCAILFFIALALTFTTRHLHGWASLLLWPRHFRFLLSGAVRSCPPLFPSSILDACWPEGLPFPCHVFLSFHAAHGVLTATIPEWFAFPPPADHVLLELSTVTHPSWLALDGMAHSVIELCKPLRHDKAVILAGEKGSVWLLESQRRTLMEWNVLEPKCLDPNLGSFTSKTWDLSKWRNLPVPIFLIGIMERRRSPL